MYFISNAPSTTQIYTLSLHDALPIYQISQYELPIVKGGEIRILTESGEKAIRLTRAHLEEDAGKSLHEAFQDKRSEEHTSELQSLTNLVCRLLLEKKKINETGLPALE